MAKDANDKRFDRERMCARKLVRLCIDAGYYVSIGDGEAYPIKRSRDTRAIFAAMQSTDSDIVVIHTSSIVGGAPRAGWFQLIYGNDCDVLSDYVDNEACNAIAYEHTNYINNRFAAYA